MDLIQMVCLALSLSLSLCFSLLFFLLWILIKTVRDISWIKCCLSQCQFDGHKYLDDARISKAAATIDDFCGPQLEWAQGTCVGEHEEQVSMSIIIQKTKMLTRVLCIFLSLLWGMMLIVFDLIDLWIVRGGDRGSQFERERVMKLIWEDGYPDWMFSIVFVLLNIDHMPFIQL